jgi:hypothetical protein
MRFVHTAAGRRRFFAYLVAFSFAITAYLAAAGGITALADPCLIGLGASLVYAFHVKDEQPQETHPARREKTATAR